jgi:sRNA-binding regulator protein Hfq
MSMDLNVNDLTIALQELSKQIEDSKEAGKKEAEKLSEYQNKGTMLEFNLTNGGIMNGKINWIDSHCLGIDTIDKQSVILYKHIIAFIQERKAI